MNLKNELDGITVVSVEQAVAAPYCGMLLADAGARVIKVERPEGDFARGYDSGVNGKSSIFAWLNRGKESIVLDMNNEEDNALLKRMLVNADVFLSNLAPGALDKKGFSLKAIHELNPKIINCLISGYGSKDPKNKKKAYDFLIQGEVGLCSVTGTESNPSRVGISITDISTGLTAFSSILRALIQGSRTAKGVNIELSMFDVLADWMNMPLLAHRYMGGAPVRMALSHSFVAPYGAYETKDDKKILLSIQNDREWNSFCCDVLCSRDLIHDARLTSNVERYKNKVYLDKIISKVFKGMSKSNLINKLETAKIAYSNLNSVQELSDHKLMRNKEVYFEGDIISIADLPITSSDNISAYVPSLDQHGKLLRNEFQLK
jgi:itaconate CoA-transferase